MPRKKIHAILCLVQTVTIYNFNEANSHETHLKFHCSFLCITCCNSRLHYGKRHSVQAAALAHPPLIHLIGHFPSPSACKPRGLPHRCGKCDLICDRLLAFPFICFRALCDSVFIYHPTCHLFSLEQASFGKSYNFPRPKGAAADWHDACVYRRLGGVICDSFRIRFRLSVL